MKTENLVILFTDIVGFTEATSLQSRSQNQKILDRHNSLLLPIVKRFRGKHIKSIGDALLLVFRSPTDGMRCAMAMQDALHEYNNVAPEGEKIHVRIAASLGEVRISGGDIFGEPVNVTSRIEGITPSDEIYLSEAVYLAMNKAEVPAVEVGLRELKGIPKPVRIFSIPRFHGTKLVADTKIAEEDQEFSFPYGGMHKNTSALSVTWSDRVGQNVDLISRSKALKTGAIICLSAVLATIGTYGLISYFSADQKKIEVVTAKVDLTAVVETPHINTTPENTPVVNTTGAASETPLAQVSVTVTASTDSASAATQPKAQTTPKSSPIMTIIQAKNAYRAGRISKPYYRQIVEKIEVEFDSKVRDAKLAYKAGKYTKAQYKDRIIFLKRRYIGED